MTKISQADSVKIKWEVSPVCTGRYRTFSSRNWPIGRVNDVNRVMIRCADQYIPAKAKAGDHPPLTLVVDIFEDGKERLVTLKARPATMKDAKALALAFFKSNPQFIGVPK